MNHYVDKDALQEFTTKLHNKQKTIFASKTDVGTPLTASTVADMTDTDKIYVYTGSETGYTSGNWYYYDGSDWVSGGVYNSAAVVTDKTLSVEDKAADGKAVGDALKAKADADGAYEDLAAGQLLSSVGIEENTPYHFRTSGGSIDIGNRMTDKIVGGTVAWNQLINPANIRGNGASLTVDGDEYTAYNTNTGGLFFGIAFNFVPKLNHIYFMGINITEGDETYSSYGYRCGNWMDSGRTQFERGENWKVYKANNTQSTYINMFVTEYNSSSYFKIKNPILIDITQMFGSTIADYIYSLEQATDGAGVAWFKKLFPDDYYEYNAGELMSVKTSAHKMVGFNAYNPTTGTAQLVGGMEYQITGTYTALTMNGETITPDADGYFTPAANGVLTVTGGNSTDTCVHLVWDGKKDGQFEEYKENAYALDSSLELRGIPKLDSSNHLYYDGDIYEDDGTVTRRYGVVDLGSLDWAKYTEKSLFYTVNAVPSKMPNNANMICSKYINDGIFIEYTDAYFPTDKIIKASNSNTLSRVCIRDDAYTDATAFKTAMSGVYLVYELATPTTEEAEPFQNPQIVDDFGTEEYVDNRDVAIPVGHDTLYMSNLRAKLEMSPNSPDGDGDYIVRQANGKNSYVPLVIPNELPAAPASDGTYKLTVTVANGAATYEWAAD